MWITILYHSNLYNIVQQYIFLYTSKKEKLYKMYNFNHFNCMVQCIKYSDCWTVTTTYLLDFFIFLNWNCISIKHNSSCSLPPRLWQPTFYFLSLNLTTLCTSCKLNHTSLSSCHCFISLIRDYFFFFF